MFKRNTAVTGFTVGFINVTTGAPVTTGTPSGFSTLDGGTQTAIAGAFTHEGLGQWSVNLTAGEMNGTIVGLVFTLTNAINVFFTIKTVLVDPDNVTNYGLTNLDVAVSSRMATYTQPAGFLAATFPAGTVANTTNITGGTITTATNLTNLPTIPANWLTAAGIAAAALNGKGDWNIGKTGYTLTQTFPVNFSDLAIAVTTGRVTVGTNADKTGYSLSSSQTFDVTGNRTGNVSGSVGSVSGAVGSVTGAVGSVTGAVGSVAGAVGSVTARVTANTDQINGSGTSANRLQKSTVAITFCTVGSGSTTTSIVTSAMDPAAAVIDQFKGKIVSFSFDTTTVNLRGQSTDITASTALGVLTVTALTTAAVSGDTFVVT